MWSELPPREHPRGSGGGRAGGSVRAGRAAGLVLLLCAAGLAGVSVSLSRSAEPPGETAAAGPRPAGPPPGVPPAGGGAGARAPAPAPEEALRQARALSEQAMTRMREGRPELALEDLDRAEACAAGADDPGLLASIHYRAGLVLQRLGRHQDALER